MMRASRMPVMSAPSRRDGFTLVELLVAISIIAVLIGILVPVLGKARNAAQSAVCISNLHQHGVAWMSLLEDRRFFPFERPSDLSVDARLDHRWDWGGVNWYAEDSGVSSGRYVLSSRPLNPYYDLPRNNRRHAPVFECPADDGLKYAPSEPYFSDDDVRGLTDAADPTTVYGIRGTSYMANDWIWVKPGSRIGYGGLIRSNDPERQPPGFTTKNSMASVTDPSRFILVGDAGPFEAGRMGKERFYRIYANGRAFDGSWAYSWWHGYQRGQMAFLDGSARAVEITPNRGSTGSYMWWMNPGKHLLDDGSATVAIFGAGTRGWDPRSYGSSGEEEDDD